MSGSSSHRIFFVPVASENIPMLRYALGATIMMSVAMAFAWDMAYLTPVLSLSFLGVGTKMPTLKGGISFVGIIAILTVIGFLTTKYFVQYIVFFVPLLALIMLSVFYTTKLTSTLKLFILMILLVMPMLGMMGTAVAFGFTLIFIFGVCVTILLVWMVFTLIPDHVQAQKKSVEKSAAQAIPENIRFTKALETLLIVFPVVLLFFAFQFTGSLLILIFVVVLSMQPAFGSKNAIAMLVGNLAGGIASIVVYELLVIVPSYLFFVLLIATVSLFVAGKLFSGGKMAPLYGMGFSTFLLIIGQSLTSTADAGSKVWLRVLQIMVAVSYVVLAQKTLEANKQWRKSKRVKENTDVQDKGVVDNPE